MPNQGKKTACPNCGKLVKKVKSHLPYCPKNPLESVTEEDADARFEEQAQRAEVERSERVRAAGTRRDFMPTRSDRRVKFPTIAWYLKPNGALPEDTFICTSAWSVDQRATQEKRGFIEVTPSKAFLMRRDDGSIVGGVVMLDLPPKERWERILRILEARREPALAYEKQRLADEQQTTIGGLTPAERAASISRIRTYTARVDALSKPVDADKLWEFFEEEVRYSRRDQNPAETIRKIVDERVDEIMEGDVD